MRSYFPSAHRPRGCPRGTESGRCYLAENADISAVDVERYKRLAVQQEKSITALQARNQESEARARDGAVNADMVEQLRSERDQISTLVRARPPNSDPPT